MSAAVKFDQLGDDERSCSDLPVAVYEVVVDVSENRTLRLDGEEEGSGSYERLEIPIE
jgi:hypothetical protein